MFLAGRVGHRVKLSATISGGRCWRARNGGRRCRRWRWRWRQGRASCSPAPAGRKTKTSQAILGVTATTAGKWRKRFLAGGIDGLLDEPKPGVTRSIGDAEVEGR
jgi:hypothetical protein